MEKKEIKTVVIYDTNDKLISKFDDSQLLFA